MPLCSPLPWCERHWSLTAGLVLFGILGVFAVACWVANKTK